MRSQLKCDRHSDLHPKRQTSVWFAWHPVKVELREGTYRWVWWESVERQGYPNYFSVFRWSYHYRLIEKVT